MIIGVTGSFGTGKTTVAKFFGRLGCKIIDADKITHRLLKPGSAVYKKIVSTFGQGIIKKDKTIDRYRLAEVVFNNKRALNKLCKLIHPYVIGIIKKITSEIARRRPDKIIVIDAPLLIEAEMADFVDRLIVVKATQEEQIKRCSKKFGFAPAQIKKRIKGQLPISKKIKLADFVIDNSDSTFKTKQQVKRIYLRLWNTVQTSQKTLTN